MINVKYIKPTKLACPQEILVSFRYKQSIVDAIRLMPDRYYDAKNREWHLSYDCLSALQKALPDEEFNIEGKPIDNKRYGEKIIEKHYELPKELKTKLYSYQEEGFNEMMNFDKFLLLWEMGLGKAQPLYSKLLTSSGYINMGDIKIGDKVFGEDGKLHKVVGVYPQGLKDVYEITFSDGTTCRCSDEHLWTVIDCHNKWRILTLNELLSQKLYYEVSGKNNIKYKNWRWKIPICKPIEFDFIDVKIDPWLLGVILGDGGISQSTITVTNSEQDIIERIREIVESDGMEFNKLQTKYCYSITENGKFNKYRQYLKELNLLGLRSENKFIPNIYKYNSVDIRFKVLQGLIATDGYIFNNIITYSTSSKQLAEDIVFLVQSLGGTCSCKEHETFYTYKGERKQGLNNFELYIKMPNDFDLVQTEKQKKQYKEVKHTGVYRKIRNIAYIGKEECQCIMVDNPSHLYLTDNMVVTHNTVCSIATALKRKELNGIKHCLIVCGVNSIKFNWQEEIKIHAGMDSIILGARKNKKGVIEVKSNKDKLEDLDNLNEFFIITNIETFRDKTIKDKLKKLVDKKVIEMIVFDECHKCRQPQAQQTKGILSVAKNVKYFYGLTGTVLSNSPLDAFVPLKLVEKENANFTNFKSRYCVYGGWGGFSIVGYRHLDELQAKLNMVSLRRTKEDVLDLPPKTYTVNYVELNTKQRKIYNDVMKSILEHIDEVSVSPSPLSQLIRLRQATADTSILSSTIQESAKFERLDEILEEQISNNEKVVVFSNWTTVTDRLVQRYDKYNPAVITGEIKDRQTQKDKFMTDASCKLLIGTISAMGTGLTLTVATTAVFVDEPYTWANYEQASDRIYRIGQKKNVTIISLLAKDTIDERIHKIMLNKKHISEAIVDNQYNLKDRKILEWLIGG